MTAELGVIKLHLGLTRFMILTKSFLIFLTLYLYNDNLSRDNHYDPIISSKKLI